MSLFVQKTYLSCNADRIYTDLENILDTYSTWKPNNQISLRHRADAADCWKDGVGSLYDNTTQKFNSHEKEFLNYNKDLPNYLQQSLEELSRYIKKPLGRARFMRLESKTGLSIHVDKEERYHLAIKTNPNAIIAEVFENQHFRTIGYHIPADSFWYRVDTRKLHFVYNGSFEDRIHLVVCPG